MLIATITTQRSGSKFLGGCFLAGTAVSPFGEVFNPDVRLAGSFQAFRDANRHDPSRETGFSYMARYFGTLEGLRSIVQFDVMFNQVEIPAITWNPYPMLFLYGCLRQARAIVIHLDRDITDAYLSMKFLETSGMAAAHNFAGEESSIERGAPVELDYSDFDLYRESQEWHRSRLYESVKDYALFYHLPYETIANAGSIPEDLRGFIVEEAAKRGIRTNRESVQYEAARIFRSNVDYRSIFANYEEFAENCLAT